MASAASSSSPPFRKRWVAFAVAGVAVLAALVVAAALADRQVVQALSHHALALRGFGQAHPVVGLAIYVTVFALSLIAFLPICLLLTVFAGFAFGVPIAAAASVAGAVLAAAGGYGLGRSTLEGFLERRLGRRAHLIRKMAQALRRNVFRYVFSLRLIPFSPFSLVSLAAGSVRAPLWPFLAATALGLTPECLIYAFAGRGVGEVVARGEAISLHTLVRPEVVWPLAAMGMLYLAAVLVRAGLAGLERSEV